MFIYSTLVVTLCLAADPLPKESRTGAAAQQHPLVFSSVSFGRQEEQSAIFDPMRLMLSQELHHPVQFQVSQSYQELVLKLQQGQIDVAFVGALAYLDARKTGGVDVLVRAVRKGMSQYRGAWFVRKSAPITKLEQLRGKTLAVVDPVSASGYLLPLALLQRMHINPQTDSKLLILGSHSAVMDALITGRADAAASYLDAGDLVAGDQAVRSIGQTSFIPTDPIVARRAVEQQWGGTLRQFFLGLRTQTAGKAFLEAMEIDGYVLGTDQDYDAFAQEVIQMRHP